MFSFFFNTGDFDVCMNARGLTLRCLLCVGLHPLVRSLGFRVRGLGLMVSAIMDVHFRPLNPKTVLETRRGGLLKVISYLQRGKHTKSLAQSPFVDEELPSRCQSINPKPFGKIQSFSRAM